MCFHSDVDGKQLYISAEPNDAATVISVIASFSNSVSIFLYHSFYLIYFPINLNGEMLIGEN